MGAFLSFLGRCLSWIPETFAESFCKFFGYVLYMGCGSRRQVLLKNLFLAFPQQTEAWRRSIARTNCSRWVETVWLFLLSSHWKRSCLQQHLSISPALRDWIEQLNRQPRSSVVLIPHVNLMETMTWIPAFFQQFPQTGVLYRPFRSSWLENWIRRTRERFGIHLLSRRQGMKSAELFLEHKGLVGILFDQSAGEVGCLTTFLDRLASTTPLPGILAEKYQADVVAVYVKRTGFLRGELCIDEIASRKTAFEITLAANQWLEKKLQTDAAFYENWLWLHRRWKTQEFPERRFQISHKRNWLPETCQAYHWKQLPKRTHVWVRLPKWLGDCVMTYPLLQALRKARPDFYMNALAPAPLVPLIQRHFPVDEVKPLPIRSGMAYFAHFFSFRSSHPDLWINFPHSLRSDLEAFCSGATQRMGIQRRGRRWLLTHTFVTQPQEQEHQTMYWYRFLQHFGLQVPLSREPISHFSPVKTLTTFGCFCGSANNPAKRWSVKYWTVLVAALLKKFPQSRCLWLGSATDRPLCEAAAASLPKERIQLLAGETNVQQLEEQLFTCSFVAANDSGGMHFSNFLGIPTVGLFGATPPYYGGPFFSSPTCVLQSATNRMEDLRPETVIEAVIRWVQEEVCC
ncbi:MAG: hypothetical protein J6Z25_01855 [Opitutales bacterium]|nr:hypothetical protein [Opitutales bacterium]